MSKEAAEKILTKMLGDLGLDSTISHEVTEEGDCLQVSSEDSKFIIGQRGDRLDDFQYLVNRVLQIQEPESDRVRVDCDHYRLNNEEKLKQKALGLAEKVKETGRPEKLPPLNAYHRRLVHNWLVDDKEIATTSPEGSSRFKRILIKKAS